MRCTSANVTDFFRDGRSLFVLLILLGCGSSESSSLHGTFIHLDPRLSDGRSSADVLAGTRHVVASQRFGTPGEIHGDWRFFNAEVADNPGGDGLRVQRKELESRSEGALRLVFNGTLHADRVHAVEIDMFLPRFHIGRLAWRSAKDAEGRLHAKEVDIHASDSFGTVRFYLAPDPDWSGEIEELWIAPEWDKLLKAAKTTCFIREVRFVTAGFYHGYEPLGGESGDGGLFEIGLEARRAWPCDLGVPLFARCRVPEGGRFVARVAALPAAGGGPVRFLLDARESGNEWQRFARVEATPDDGWRPICADLANLSDREVELRLLAVKDEEVPSPGRAPEQCACLWGEPALLGRVPGPTRPNVLLVTLDTTRGDHIGDPDKTPCIARLGEEGIYFENAWSTCNSTVPSHATILTGRYAREHGAVANRFFLDLRNTTLAEMFRSAGYHTAAAVSATHIHGGSGFGQGFDRFRQADNKSIDDGSWTAKAVKAWLEEWKAEGDRPFFLWLHYFDPHTPYGPPGDYARRYADRLGVEVPPSVKVSPDPPDAGSETNFAKTWRLAISNQEPLKFQYSASVGYVDSLVEDVISAMKKCAYKDNTVLLMTADHGESLGEHDIWYNHEGLFEEALRVPLVLKVPGGPSGLRPRDLVSTIDIAPTLLSLCGLEATGSIHGRDLLAVAKEGGEADRRIWFEYTGQEQVGTRDGNHHFITTLEGMEYGTRIETGPAGERRAARIPVQKGAHFLYDIRDDPKMGRNLAGDRMETVEVYLGLIERWRDGLAEGDVIERPLSDEEERRLRDLGY